MKNNWQKTSLQDCLKSVVDYRGKTPKKLGMSWSKSGYRALSALNVKTGGLTKLNEVNYANEGLYKKWMKDEVLRGDILLTSEAPAGQVIVWDSDEKILLSQRLYCLKIEDFVDAWYLKYYLQSETGQKNILRNNSGSTAVGISAKTFDNITVFLPDIAIQKSISKILYLLDKKIELSAKINEKLEKIARDIYDYWFVQFDFPDENNRPYKTNGGVMIWSEELKREIPKDWGAKKLSKYLDIGSGFGFKPNTYIKDGKYIVVTIKNVQDGFLDISTAEKVAEIPDLIKDFCILKVGDALISLTGNVGRICLVDSENLLLNQRVGKLILYDKRYFEYFYLLLSSIEQQNRLEQISGGSSQANLSPLQAVDTFVVIPDHKMIEKFQAMLSPIFERVIKNRQESVKLAELRDWLLPMLMYGQININ